jgi:hypothetical protein
LVDGSYVSTHHITSTLCDLSTPNLLRITASVVTNKPTYVNNIGVASVYTVSSPWSLIISTAKQKNSK